MFTETQANKFSNVGFQIYTMKLCCIYAFYYNLWKMNGNIKSMVAQKGIKSVVKDNLCVVFSNNIMCSD